MADISFYNSVAESVCIFKNRASDVAYPIACLCLSRAAKERFSRGCDELFGFFTYLAYAEGICTVAMKALVARADIYLYDIALVQYAVFARYTVNNLVVQADAGAAGETAVSEKRGFGASLLYILADSYVQLLCGNAFADMISGDKYCLAGDTSRFTHDSQLFAVFY